MSRLEKGWNTKLLCIYIFVVLVHILFRSMAFVAVCTVQET